MSEAGRQQLGLLPKLVIWLAVLLLAAGLLWHGVSAAVLARFWHDLIDRPSGPMKFRFVLQPCMAAFAAIHDGIKDARAGRAPYFWTIAGNRRERLGRLREGLIATARIILLGIAMDVIYQVLAFKTFYPAESLVVAVVLAFIPYVALRGPVNRIARRWRRAAPGAVP